MVLVVAVLILAVLLGAFILKPRNRQSGDTKKFDTNVTDNAKDLKLYTKANIALHNKRNDCWLIIKGKVYDVSSYVEEHPGGDAILSHAGDDTTEGFYGPQHPSGAFQLIEDFYIGDLKE